jgi:hypothetical protein
MNPLRTDAGRLEFCDQYFHTVQAELQYVSENYREFVLPLDVDKELTDRPFFWMWAEKTGQPITPTTLRLAFSKEARDRENERLKQEALAKIEGKVLTPAERMFFRPPTAEFIDYGCFRLEKIFQSVDSRGRFACVVCATGDKSEPAIPWFCINGIISFCCDSIEQQWFSIGVCLQNGQIVDDFYTRMSRIHMETASPNEIMKHATLPLNQAVKRLKDYIYQVVQSHPTNWAADANMRLDEEISRLETYYNSVIYDADEGEREILLTDLKRKKSDLQHLHSPKITIENKQMALIGLHMKH